MIRVLLLLLTTGLLLGLAVPDSASADGIRGIGPRLGMSVNADQFHFGGHIDMGDLSPRIMIQPNLEIGVGDNLTTIAPSFELDYRFREDWGVWTPYLGAGIGPIFYSPDNGDNFTKLGLYMQFGVGKGSISNRASHFFIEGKLGLADAPDFKATVGWTFGS